MKLIAANVAKLGNVLEMTPTSFLYKMAATTLLFLPLFTQCLIYILVAQTHLHHVNPLQTSRLPLYLILAILVVWLPNPGSELFRLLVLQAFNYPLEPCSMRAPMIT